jgi:hypothetical protein
MESTKLVTRNNREANQEVVKQALLENEKMTALRESIKRSAKLDIMSEKDFPVMSPKFSWKKMEAKLEEADSATSFTQVLRAGVQTAVNAAYQTVNTTFEDWAHVIQSTKDTELYAPLQGISFPRELAQGGKFSEVRAAGLDIKIKNRTYGSLFPVEKVLLDDDQTGQFQKMSGLLGQYLKMVLEVLCYAKLASSTNEMKYGELVVPASETKPADESNYPYAQAVAPFIGGGYNRAAAAGGLTQTNLQLGFQSLMVQKNLLGLRMLVQPDRVICGPKYIFDLSVLLNSSYYPTGATAGATGGAFAINPLESIADKTISRFIFTPSTGALDDGTSTAWWLVDSKVPWFVLQIREGATVTMEAPNSGAAFENNIIRFKGETRANADFIDPRFVYNGGGF